MVSRTRPELARAGTRKRAARPKPRRAGLAIPERALARANGAADAAVQGHRHRSDDGAHSWEEERRAIERTDASRLRAALPPLTPSPPPHPPPPRDAPRRFRAPELITKEMVDGGERVSKSRRASAGIPIPQPPPPATRNCSYESGHGVRRPRGGGGRKHCNHLRGPKGGDAERGHVHRLHRPELPPRHDLVELVCEQPGNAFAATAPLPMPNPIIAGGSLPRSLNGSSRPALRRRRRRANLRSITRMWPSAG